MTDPLPDVWSVETAAAFLRLSEERVLQFVRAGRIAGKQLKREWALSRPSVLAFKKVKRKAGRGAATA